MEFEEWEPVYERILADFGFGRGADERARDAIAAHATAFDTERLDCTGDVVAIAGAGPSLESETEVARRADAVFAASSAADTLRETGVSVDCMVTDLDKTPRTARELTHEGVPVAAHAHGDNIPEIERWVPAFDAAHTLATTQAEPTDSVFNFGGFTDGDRAAFLADAMGADELVFAGWDFEDSSVDPSKERKLRWAERLLYWLERRRNERFAVLDGRRENLELP